MAIKTDIVEERAGLQKRIAEVQKLCMDEWLAMSHQLATQRNAELFAMMARVRAIDKMLARRKR